MMQKFQGEFRDSFAETDLRVSFTEVRHALEMMELQLTLRFGAMLVLAVALVAILKLASQCRL